MGRSLIIPKPFYYGSALGATIMSLILKREIALYQHLSDSCTRLGGSTCSNPMAVHMDIFPKNHSASS